MKLLKVYSRASAPTKIILFGEHFVVYGKPAILAAIEKRIYSSINIRNDNSINLNINNIHEEIDIDNILLLKDKGFTNLAHPLFIVIYDTLMRFNARFGLNVKIDSDVPFGSGLGTSSAASASLITTIFNLFGMFDKEEIFSLTLNAEKLIHNNPSGADPAISISGGLIIFRKYDDNKMIIPLEYDKELEFMIVYSGEERITGKMVDNVRSIKDKNPQLFEIFANKSEEITQDAIQALKNKDYALVGKLMTKNHELLNRLGVSSQTLNRLVEHALNNGALGAKLTGAGGGGSIIVLFNADNRNRLLEAFKGNKIFVTKISNNGIKIE